MKKTFVTAAITGSVHTPSLSEYLPITPEQIINSAVEAHAAGAAIVHIHTRNPETGEPNNDPVLMKQIVEGIRAKCDVVIGITTGGAIGMSTEDRVKAVPIVNAELASCNAGTMNFAYPGIADKIEKDGGAKFDWEIPYTRATYNLTFPNTFQGIEDYLKIMKEYDTKPEFEVYDLGMVHNLHYFKKNEMIEEPIYLQFVLGIMGGLPATVENLVLLVNEAKRLLGEDIIWSCAAAGRNQFDIMAVATVLGGNIRVGLEDNLYIEKGVLAKSNAEMVEKYCKIAELLGRETATPNEAREILKIKK